MIKIGITGIDGLIGWHMRAFLHSYPEVQVVKADRATFAAKEKLSNFIASSDVIIHFAGMNRGDEQVVAAANIKLVEDLIATCESLKRKPHIIFPSSTHIFRDTAYGNSKKICSERLREWAKRSGAVFTNLILPNVFGEGGKPFYNSVVSTFCHQMANGEKPEIIKDIEIELIHAQTIAEKIYDIINSRTDGDILVAGTRMTVTQLLAKLTNFADMYDRQIIPDLGNELDLNIFNTYRSYLYPKKYPIPVILHEDERGSLFEAIKSLNPGQTFISITKPGITRGNHYHTKKIERFFVLNGMAEIKIRKLFTDKIEIFKVDGKSPKYIDIPVFHIHNITNTGADDLTTLFWANEIFDPAKPDTFKEKVQVINEKN